MKQTIEIPEGFELKKVSDTEYQIVKKESELPNTWEEFCEKYPLKKDECYIDSFCYIRCTDPRDRNSYGDLNVLPNEKYAEAVLALCQLIQLRDCYRQGWKRPLLTKYIEPVSCICFNLNGPITAIESNHHQVFSFQSKEVRDKFFINFRDLLEKVKYLYK